MSALLSLISAITLALVLPAAGQPPSASASAACSAISAAGIKSLGAATDALNPQFIDAKNHYWSAANADLHPACAVFPTSADEVSQIVTILQNNTGVNFAVKSGGHNPNVGFSSTDGGVLISMSKISSTVVSSDLTTADIGPGARWVEVAKALDPYGITVVSGRIGDVGVGGLTLGGGLSFLSAEYGMVCDNVINFEVVLADASIVNANASSNTGLYWALKGGGNQFGIVTKFTMKTHVIGQIWGGIRSYDASEAAALLNATQDFNANYDKHPKAAVIVTGEIAVSTLLEFFVVFFFYDGPTPPTGVFDAFNAIPTLTDGVKVQSYYDLVNSNDATNLYGQRYLIRGTTLPNLPGTTGKDLYNYHYKTWSKYVKSQSIPYPGFIFSIAFQPMPYIIPAQSVAAGGNALGMKPTDGDRMWMDYNLSWLTPLGDDTAHSMAMNITATIDEYAKKTYVGVPSTHYQSGDLEGLEYGPIFMNDATYDQKPLQTYENDGYNRLKTIQKSVDPEGFFPGRTGGFKFT
ncbi:FAD-binding-containing protein [Venustampulla echinocandica]|uniref:FAD-binding-containing protein n=1 Tax=Venustampulla echinocandica TaxID=2656787 RepID=A0A370TX02_9HELO|nr:FAD-binding-containing protein [Venustampulla echinocandica]RDL40051.1 FAD-binding-containing protein [Venustampulla echinocandica]